MIYKDNKEVIGVYKQGTPIARVYKGNYLIFGSSSTEEPEAPIASDVLEFEFTGSTLTYKMNGTSYTATTSPFSAKLSDIGISEWTSASNMFASQKNLTKVISLPDTSNVTAMSSMFYGCRKLASLNMKNCNTSEVVYMGAMYFNCSGLTSLDLSNWNTTKVEYTNQMFYGCIALEKLDITNWDLFNVTDAEDMFAGCSALRQLKWNHLGTSSGHTLANFISCTNLGIGYENDLRNTFVVNSYDRATAGYPNLTLNFATNSKALFTSNEIAQMTSKGYTIA